MSFVIIKHVLYKYSESVSINGERHEAFRNFAKKSDQDQQSMTSA